MDKGDSKNSTGSLAVEALKHINALEAEERLREESKKKHKLNSKKIAKQEKEKFEKSLKGMTKEQKIAANKARVAKYHPEPDIKDFTPSYKRVLQKSKFKKTLKNIYMRIVSVPMGGMNKNK